MHFYSVFWQIYKQNDNSYAKENTIYTFLSNGREENNPIIRTFAPAKQYYLPKQQTIMDDYPAETGTMDIHEVSPNMIVRRP